MCLFCHFECIPTNFRKSVISLPIPLQNGSYTSVFTCVCCNSSHTILGILQFTEIEFIEIPEKCKIVIFIYNKF